MTAKKNGNDGRTRLKVKRVVFRVHWRKARSQWGVSGDGLLAYFNTKALAIRCASMDCDYMFRNSGIRTQLVIYRKDGRIQSERTYGADPVRRKG